MKRTRIALIAAALVTASVLAGAMPASAHNGGSRPAAAAAVNKFSLSTDIDLATYQRCLGINYSNSTAGAWKCTYANDQLWHLGGQLGTSGYYQIVNDKGQCLGVQGGSTADGAQVVGWGCLGTSHQDQYWTIDFLYPSSSYLVYVFNYKSGYVLDLWNGSLANGAPIKQYHWVPGDDHQIWVYVAPSP
jgi:hypothetical protein